LDGSGFAEEALPLATEIASRARANVGLLLVHQPPAVPLVRGSSAVFDTLDHQLREAEARYLQGVEARLRGPGLDSIEGAVLSGPVGESLQAEIERRGADLVVMSTHGRGGFGRIWLGSVADRLLHALRLPLLLVRPRVDAKSSAPSVVEQVVVPLDGSPLAESVLEHAIVLATLFGAELHLIRVVPPALYLAPGLDFPITYNPAVDPAVDAALEQEASDYLGALAGTLRSRGLRVSTVVERNAFVADALLTAVQDVPGALLCVSTHGRSGGGRALLGSVADKLVRGASCPVFVLRPGTTASSASLADAASAQQPRQAFAGTG